MAIVYYTEYTGWYCDSNNDTVTVSLKRRYDIDPNEPIQLEPEIKPLIFTGHDDEPTVISYLQDSITTKLNPINGSECGLGIMIVEGMEFSDLYTADEKEWLLQLEGAVTWSGFVIPDDFEEPFSAKPYPARMSATDALGTLDEIPFSMEDGTLYRGMLSDLGVVRLCLEKTGLSLPYTIGVNTSAIGPMGSTNPNICVLAQTYIDSARFIDEDGIPFSCKEVLRSVLERYSARLHQVNGRWQIINALELSFGSVKGWLFDANLVPNGFQEVVNQITAGGLNREIQPVGNIKLNPAYLNSTAYYQFGYPSNKLENGDMNAWTTKPSGLPDGWSTSGSITAIGKVRQVNGQDTIDYFIEMSGQGTGYVKNDNLVLIRAGEKSIINFDMYAPGVAQTDGLGSLKVRLAILIKSDEGDYYTNSGWKVTEDFYYIDYLFRDLVNQIRVSFEVVSLPVDYQMTFGVKQLRTAVNTNLVTQINNAEIQQKQENELTKIAIGEFNRQTSTKKQSFKPEPILLLHSTETAEDRTSRMSIVTPNPINVPVQFSRANVPGENKYLLQIVANTQLRLHSRPYRIFQADFHGVANITPNTILTTDLLSGQFMFLSGSFDLKTNIHSLRFAEVLTADIDYIEEQRQDYGNENDKNGIDVANPVGVGNVGTIPFNPGNFVPAGEVPTEASVQEAITEQGGGTYMSPRRMYDWWDEKRQQDESIPGDWNFTGTPTIDGVPIAVGGMTGIVSSDSTMNMLSTNETQVYSGLTAATWIAPNVSNNLWRKIYVKNRGGDVLTIVTQNTTNDFYLNAPTTSILINPGDAIILINDGTYWNIN